MNAAELTCVMTTIQEPTPCARELARRLSDLDGRLIVIGDRKGPARFDLPGSRFVPLGQQHSLPFRLARLLPDGHYARKNLGYLLAMEEGAPCLYETDDDNMPGPGWAPRQLHVQAQRVAPRPWMNVYGVYSRQNIWPRGLPLERIADPATRAHDPGAPLRTTTAPIQQGLANGAPDVDAVWRLVFGHEVDFEPGPSLLLPRGTWCPFNSQSTWWWPAAYPLLYLPSHCSFRMTDIWRSFVAQRCLWLLDQGVVFHGPEVIQERNVHRLVRDFEDEVPGYLHNQRLVDCLSALELRQGLGAVGENLRLCYDALIRHGIMPAAETPLVAAWLDDVEALTAGKAPFRNTAGRQAA